LVALCCSSVFASRLNNSGRETVKKNTTLQELGSLHHCFAQWAIGLEHLSILRDMESQAHSMFLWWNKASFEPREPCKWPESSLIIKLQTASNVLVVSLHMDTSHLPLSSLGFKTDTPTYIITGTVNPQPPDTSSKGLWWLINLLNSCGKPNAINHPQVMVAERNTSRPWRMDCQWLWMVTIFSFLVLFFHGNSWRFSGWGLQYLVMLVFWTVNTWWDTFWRNLQVSLSAQVSTTSQPSPKVYKTNIKQSGERVKHWKPWKRHPSIHHPFHLWGPRLMDGMEPSVTTSRKRGTDSTCNTWYPASFMGGSSYP